MIERTIDEILDEAYELPDSLTKVALSEEAVRLADSAGDIFEAWDVRMDLIHTAVFSGADDKALPAFAWCLAQFDADPDSFDVEFLLKHYKWVTAAVSEFPQISRERIHELEDDMERRYSEYGFSLQVVHKVRAGNALGMGDFELGQKHFELWQTLSRDSLSDCKLCEEHNRAEFEMLIGAEEEALAIACAVLAGGKSCTAVPAATYADVLRPLCRAGRVDEAWDAHRRGYRMVADDMEELDSLSSHVEFLAAQAEFASAVSIFERHLPLAFKNPFERVRLELLSAGHFLFETMGDGPGRKNTRKLRLPGAVPVLHDNGQYNLRDVSEWCRSEALAIADRFDRRNGNDFQRRTLEQGPEFSRAASVL
jgi:hypothetical protein